MLTVDSYRKIVEMHRKCSGQCSCKMLLEHIKELHNLINRELKPQGPDDCYTPADLDRVKELSRAS